MAYEATFIALSLFVESGDEADGNDDIDFDEFILSEKENSSTSDEDTFLMLTLQF